MTEDYNSGKWIGWNGGECPVHPESVIDIAHSTRGVVCGETAEQWFWDGEKCRVIAFRVVKEHREPRECWAVGKHMHDSLAEAEAFRAQVDASNPGRGYLDTPITHWREVVD